MPYSDVDASPCPQGLVEYLDGVAVRVAPIKALLRCLVRQGPGDLVLDVGCGPGHDLLAFGTDGLAAVGVEPSQVMLSAARTNCLAGGVTPRLVQGDGMGLPFPTGRFTGCLLDRVLQHVCDPAAVLAEVHRVLRPGGVVAIFEPDWASFSIDADDDGAATAVASQVAAGVPQRRIGFRLQRLLVEAGFAEVTVALEPVSATDLGRLGLLLNLDLATERAIAAGLVTAERARRLLADLERRSEAGSLFAVMNRYIAWATVPLPA
jgi:SAM-dependent methyltransferase